MKHGEKYKATENLGVKDIAKLIRADIARVNPFIKVSVRIERYSMGQSINVQIKEVPNEILNHAYVKNYWFVDGDSIRHNISAPHMNACERYTDYGRALKDLIKKIVAAYNFDDCDYQSDYFHVRFYSSVEFDSLLEERERFKILGVGEVAS